MNPVDFPTHNFSGETIEMNSAGSSEVRIFLWFYNLTQTTQEWIISRRRINVDPSWTDFLGFGETTDQFGGVIIDGFTMDSVLWVAPGYISQTVENGEILGLYPFIYPTSAGGCGTYRYYLGTDADPFQDSVDIQVCFTVGLENLSEIEASIYPNPSSSQLNVEADVTDASIAITDLSGRTLLVEQFNNEMNIDVTELNDGIYFVIIEKQGSTAIKKKIIVQH